MNLPTLAVLTLALLPGAAVASPLSGHPRLYFTAGDLPHLRALREEGVHTRIWENLSESADWCAGKTPRGEWIPTVSPDPLYENLYDRFYGAMHDMAVIEHLAFASVLSPPANDPYFEPARRWVLAGARVWKNEATNTPDASKAYAVLRVLKAIAVAYDVLYERLEEDERREIRDTLVTVGRAYFTFFQEPTTAGEGYNKHHGSVDAPPLGIVALALLGEIPEAERWLELVVEKHTAYLLPSALTLSGTNEQSSNFWASTLQYRIFFVDALRRVTGRDLFAEYPGALPGRIALAAVAGPHPRGRRYGEANSSVLFGPSYGQLDYWSPVLLFLAREKRRPLFQHLALWDGSLGTLQRTRYITPTRSEELLFSFGPYAYLWYDPTVPARVEEHAPLAFRFPEPQVDESYLRASYLAGGLVVGMKKGGLVVHAGGRPVLVDQLDVADVNQPAPPVEEALVSDDGKTAHLRCVGPQSAGLGEQRVELERPDTLVIRREATQSLAWWYAGEARREKNTLVWPDGARLEVTHGSIHSIDPSGYVETKTHYAGMQFADPRPMTYPVVTAEPSDGRLEIRVTVPSGETMPSRETVPSSETAPSRKEGSERAEADRQEVIYGRKHGMALTLDVFRPDVLGPTAERNGAGIVWIESSGWSSSHAGVSPRIAATFLKRGYTVFAVVHGSAPRFTLPDAADDIHRAVRYVRHHAAQWGVDAQRLGAGGTSAGGHLALLLGTASKEGDPAAADPVDRTSSRVQAVACLYPPTDFLNYGAPGKSGLGQGPLAVNATAFDFHEWRDATGRYERIRNSERIQTIGREMSPITHVSPDDAPTRIVHGDADKNVPFQQARSFVDKLEAAGVPTDLVVRKGAGHGWPEWLDDLELLADWFDEQLVNAKR